MMNFEQTLRIGVVVLVSVAAAGCQSVPRTAESEAAESVVVTLWTDQFELFVEYPPLRVGEPAQFAAHLTHLETFEPVTDGPVRFRYARQGRVVGEKVLEVPLRPGLYVPEFTFEEPGEYSLTILLEIPKGSGTIQVEPLEVFDANSELPPAEEILVLGDRVNYLKEQQWKLPFRTELAQTQTLRESISVSGRIIADPDRDFHVLPPLAGRFTAPPGGVPKVGQTVRKGQLLGFLEPPLPASARAALESNQMQTQASLVQLQEKASNVEARVAELTSRLALARQEKARVDRLLAIQAVPQKRVESASKEVEIAEADLQAARRNLRFFDETLDRVGTGNPSAELEHSIGIYAPGNGTMIEFHGSLGAFVEPNESLFRVVDLSRVWIRANVPENQIHRINDPKEGRIKLAGGFLLELGPENSRLVAIGDVVDPETRTIPIIWSTENTGRQLKIGMLITVEVFSGETTGLSVPLSAVFQEDNKKLVYVHVSGETFDRRIVETGVEDAGMIQILNGLAAGERVVTEGGYEVTLAARSSNMPVGEGHVH